MGYVPYQLFKTLGFIQRSRWVEWVASCQAALGGDDYGLPLRISWNRRLWRRFFGGCLGRIPKQGGIRSCFGDWIFRFGKMVIRSFFWKTSFFCFGVIKVANSFQSYFGLLVVAAIATTPSKAPMRPWPTRWSPGLGRGLGVSNIWSIEVV